MPNERVAAPNPDPTDDALFEEAPSDGGRKGPLTPLRLLLAVVVLAIIAMWVYAFSGLAKRPAPDALTDTGVGQQGEAICKDTFEQLAALPKANKTPDQNQRADVVVRSDELLTSMVDRLATLKITGGPEDRVRDQKIYDEWIGDWRTYISNRQDYAARLRTDASARIFVARKGAKQITEPIDGFAAANQMPSCKSPGDIF